MHLTLRQKVAFGVGAVGKDMVYMLSANYVMFYYQDILGLSPSFVGLILMIARIFDAVNDPFMGILVAKTKSRFGRFRPWLVSGTVLNALVLVAMFAAPSLEGTGLMVFFAVIYILWGTTYTMMDIPYWSMIPAITDTPKDTEQLSVIGRTCAGVGSALIQMLTLMFVGIFGGGTDRAGFRMVAIIVAVIFVVTEVFCALSIRERDGETMQTASIGEMFRALFANDQALVVVLTIVLINTAQLADKFNFPQPGTDRTVTLSKSILKAGEAAHYFEAHTIPTLLSSTEKGDITTNGTNTFTVVMGGDRNALKNFIEEFSGGKFIILYKHIKDTVWHIIGEAERPMILGNTETKDDADGRYSTLTFTRPSVYLDCLVDFGSNGSIQDLLDGNPSA